MQPASPEATRLARRLRQLREQQWPDARLTQKTLARAFSAEEALAAATVSSWESGSAPKIPPRHRLRAYARFFATPRSIERPPTLLPWEKLTSDELTVPPGGWIAIEDSRLGASEASGECGGARWSLRITPSTPELRHLRPELLYRAPVPRTKLTSPAPLARFDGSITTPAGEQAGDRVRAGLPREVDDAAEVASRA